MPSGVYPRTEEHKRKIKEHHKGMLGRKHTEETKNKLSIAKKGKKHTEETKRKISGALKGHKGYWKDRKLSEETKKKMSETQKRIGNKPPSFLGKHLSEEAKRKLRENRKREKGSNWRGGITPFRIRIHHSPQYKLWRQRVFIRDDFTCQRCGDDKGGNLNVHHCKKSFSKLLQEVRQNLPLLDLFEAVMIYTPFWNVDNGETLCLKCHKKTKNYLK